MLRLAIDSKNLNMSVNFHWGCQDKICKDPVCMFEVTGNTKHGSGGEDCNSTQVYSARRLCCCEDIITNNDMHERAYHDDSQ